MPSPIPPEIWDLVFRQLPPNTHLKVRQVSRAWRDIVDSTPELWTLVHISRARQFAVPGLQRWLKMSRDLAIDVVVRVQGMMPPALGILHDHLHRFRTLKIHAPMLKAADTVLVSIALPKNKRGVPLLEELCITVCGVSATLNPPHFEHGFYPAPRLKRLAVDARRLPHPSTKFLSTVTSLTITSPMGQRPSVNALLYTIAAIPCLETFMYSASDVFSYQATHSIDYPRIVRLPHLQKVDVTVPGCGQDILQCLEAPSLTSVRLDGWREYDYAEDWLDDGFTDLSALIIRLPQRSPSIHSLDLHCVQPLKSQTLNWLLGCNAYSELEELRIENSTITDTALKKAAPHGPLRRLELRRCPNVTGGALKHYVTSRRYSAPGDFQLLVSACPGVTDKDLAHLSQLVDVRDQ